jgi:hypothetical protein
MKNLFGKIAFCLSLISLAICDVKYIEDIVFRLAPVSIRGSMNTPFEIITCEMDLPIEFDTLLTVDTADKMLHLSYEDAVSYTKEFDKLIKQGEEFSSKCEMGSLFKYSKNNFRLHLNLNPSWNNGFIVENVNLITKDDGWTIQIKIEEYYYKRQFMVIYFDFEKLRSLEEIEVLVAWLKTLSTK